MFDQYSERAMRVVFLARFIAGQQGAPSIGVEHLVGGLIHEDQGEIAGLLGIPPEHLGAFPGEAARQPFFSAEAASQVLLRLRQDIPNSQPIGMAEDMAVSPALGEVFASATALCSEMHQNKVEPLHLLAAVLSGNSGVASDALVHVGVTKEAAIAAIRNL